MFLNVARIASPSLPEKMEGSVEVSYTNSPGSAQSSTILPCSTIIMHCPSATAIMEPLEMMLSLPRLEERPEPRLYPRAARTFSGRESQ